jgi:AbiV family abortive infection protein
MTLSADQLKAGRLKALQNAKELLRESTLLFDNGFWARSVFLSTVVGEELGKYVMLIGAVAEVVVLKDSFDWKKFWRRYLSHTKKNQIILMLEDFMLSEVDDLTSYFKGLPGLAYDVELGRQLALYSNIIGDGFHSPSELFVEQMAANALTWARGRVKLIQDSEEKVFAKIDTMASEELQERLLSFNAKFRRGLTIDKGR